MRAIDSIRPSPIAGTWYEANPQILARQMDAWLESVTPREGTLALVVPHAGHRYSGAVAAQAYGRVRGSAPRVVTILAPLHTYHPAPFLTSGHDFYATPLGKIRVNAPLVEKLNAELRARLGIGLTAIVNDGEHALEIQLPFLQRTLKGDFTLVPVMVRTQDPAEAFALGEALAATLKSESALLVASTDLSHFHPQAVARRLDDAMLAALTQLDPQALFALEASGRGEACGLGALAATLWAARALGGQRAEVVARSTSGEVSGDFERVVGYGAAVIF